MEYRVVTDEELAEEAKLSDEMVSWESRCPKCDEQHTDLLAWLDDETVECQGCETTYTP